MKSDRTLRKWYCTINRRFFDGLCSDKVCVRWANESEEQEARWEEQYFGWAQPIEHPRYRFALVLSQIKNQPKRNYLGTLALSTLAHEMCHIATECRDDHGPAFENWRVHIAARGIFRKHALYRNVTIF